VIIKPADKRDFHAGRVARLTVAENFVAAAAASERLLERARELIVQERVDGPDNAIYFASSTLRPEGGS
jgi:hypothetical protein